MLDINEGKFESSLHICSKPCLLSVKRTLTASVESTVQGLALLPKCSGEDQRRGKTMEESSQGSGV